jgi:hypothetical protein
MLVYVRYSTGVNSGVHEFATRALRLQDITEVSDVREEDSRKEFCYFVVVQSADGTKHYLHSRPYTTRKEAEMGQMATVTLLNALELYYERLKHIEQEHPLLFKTVDPATEKLVTGKISYYERPVYTIEL